MQVTFQDLEKMKKTTAQLKIKSALYGERDTGLSLEYLNAVEGLIIDKMKSMKGSDEDDWKERA